MNVRGKIAKTENQRDLEPESVPERRRFSLWQLISEFGQQFFDSVGVIALNFKDVAVDGAPRAAGRFELRQQGGQIVGVGFQPPDDSRDLALRSLLDGNPCGLFPRRRQHRSGRRAGAVRFQQPAPFAGGRLVERRAGKESCHIVSF